ncbi:TOBE domain-containing protein [Halorussus lipolyticus]|uniref:TOBE domain-containing protein n=1 Tax=Halorussus lipolyticus TaxID=3034024 RepID=UPI0023E7A009|nr:TOBE domain-containing protein [Halorussus sp. DT80]
MDAGFEAHLRADGVEFDADDADLLRAVDREGSLNRAAEALGRSYSRAHQRLTALEDALGPLVARQRGGSGGGGSELTDEARDVLARFERLRTEFTGTAEVEESVLSGRVVSREGELATVETSAGQVRALAPEADTDAVQVAVRADAVTLHAPADAPAEEATSARNRFAGTISAIDSGEQVARVLVDVDADALLGALVTMSSVEKLDLREDSDVVASFKATATRASPRET